MDLIPLDENFIKEVFYEYYNKDSTVNNQYNKLVSSVYKQTNHDYKNVAFFLTELCIKDLNFYSDTYKYLPIWNKKYTEKILNYFKLSIESLRIGLYIYDNFSNLFKNIFMNPNKMFFLTKEEYIHIHNFLEEKYDLNYYFTRKRIFKIDYHILNDHILCIEDRIVLNIKNRDIIIIPESLSIIKKIAILLRKKDKEIRLCNCNSFHTNEEVISVEDNNFLFTFLKCRFKKNVILEFNGNEFKYTLYKYIKDNF